MVGVSFFFISIFFTLYSWYTIMAINKREIIMSGGHHGHSHAHGHHHHHHHGDKTSKGILIAFYLNFFFAIVEFFGGYYTNSMAITSDALHDLGDSFFLAMAYVFEKFSKKGPSENYTYGHRRFSIFSGFLNAVILLAGSLVILYFSFQRLASPPDVHPVGMLVFSILGILVNGISVYKLSGGDGVNERMVFLHLMEDLLGWVAVLIVSVVLLYWYFPILDPILSILMSFYILWHVFKTLKHVFEIFLQKFPSDIDMAKLKEKIEAVTGVDQAHLLQGWTIDGEEHILTLHLGVEEGLEISDLIKIKSQLKDDLVKEFNIRPTIEFEFPGEVCDDKKEGP